MGNYIRRRVSGGTYFFTVNPLDRRTSLLVDHIDKLRAAFRDIKTAHPYHVDAIVILPEHLHTIWTLPPGDDDFSTRWRMIKSHFSRGIRSDEHERSESRKKHAERSIWQRRFWEYTIRDEDDYIAHVDYIHYNPVKHGYVRRPIDWPHSSLHQFVKDDVLPENWGTNEPPRDWDGG